ncbi:trypsin, alkaline B-like [Spodoptera frugiperda]|uniref:trypsin n=1 Tax=Spodoptera frugiperda TaxID=7108 RepID=A0A9R0CYJ1_SPOFR|nr:trypsin, alkaline B-like [Spodoptera frugiperda]
MRAIILLALLGSALAFNRHSSRIVGGTATNIETYPYMANMQRSQFGIFFSQSCGGSLLTTTSVLSAAHCFYEDYAWQWRVVLGTSLRSQGGSEHSIQRIIMHPQYIDEILNNDVAVVRLNVPAVYSNSIQPARIPGRDYHLADGSLVTHVGWGRQWTNGPLSEQLLHVHLDIINQEECAVRYAYLKTQPGYEDWPDINEGMVCAGILDVGGKDACQGDSGGPLAHHGDIIVGVTSWGFDCGHAFYPGISARVSQYTDWIVANAN